MNRPPNDQFLVVDTKLEKQRQQHYWSTQLEGDKQQIKLRSVTITHEGDEAKRFGDFPVTLAAEDN